MKPAYLMGHALHVLNIAQTRTFSPMHRCVYTRQAVPSASGTNCLQCSDTNLVVIHQIKVYQPQLNNADALLMCGTRCSRRVKFPTPVPMQGTLTFPEHLVPRTKKAPTLFIVDRVVIGIPLFGLDLNYLSLHPIINFITRLKIFRGAGN